MSALSNPQLVARLKHFEAMKTLQFNLYSPSSMLSHLEDVFILREYYASEHIPGTPIDNEYSETINYGYWALVAQQLATSIQRKMTQP